VPPRVQSSVAADVNHLDFNRVNPTTGPIGAEPGDALKITLLEFEPSGWGWTAIIPGFGRLCSAGMRVCR
jgi:acetamidase/formamidase